tara:strand:- start:25405 stop:26181 length:777 start_codon:yes stop_codon:yes gene_type:complete
LKQPDFIIGGATRSGIGALSHILDHHPQVFIPHLKEHRFFHQNDLTQHKIESCKVDFEDAVNPNNKTQISKNRVLHGEKEFDPERAAQGCPNAKIIFTLRNPVERAYVQFYHALADKKETVRTFEHAMEAELSGLRSPDTTGRCWIYKNQYQTHLDQWLSHYSRENILILIYEEWTDRRNSNLGPLEDFLGLEIDSLLDNHDGNFDPKAQIESLREDYPKKYPALSDATKEQLEDIFSVDKTYVSNLLGRDIPTWNRF